MTTQINLIKYPTADDWWLAEAIARITMGLPTKSDPPTGVWKRRILRARHSPIRELKFVVQLVNVPYWVSVHLCRHIHAQPYVASQRNDRQNDYDRRKAPQDAPVTMVWSMNAEELMTIANKRLCRKASPETREVVQAICEAVEKRCPEFEGLLVPMCDYHGGVCYEMNPCGRRDV
jgi:thymidylate synthase ThyX